MNETRNDIAEQVLAARTEKLQKIKHYAKRMIWIRFRREGIHCYPAAKTDPELATGDEYDVSFLANDHRHIFHFKVGIEVKHNDRDIEFIQFKRWILAHFEKGILDLNHKSCEMISDDIFDYIALRYPDRDIDISVSEDGENGSHITYNK